MSTCPVCQSEAELAFSCDFINTKPPVDKPLINFATAYHRCTECGAHFVPEMLEWTPEQFSEKCYNASYHFHDGDICNPEGNRILKLVATLTTQFPDMHRKKHLDYGCGKGYAVEKLKAQGWGSIGYDPFHMPDVKLGTQKFDLITCVEVLEHAANIHELFDFFKKHLAPHGVIYTTTEVCDPVADKKNHYYFCPRVGHLLIHTNRSLDVLARRYGFNCIHLGQSEHLFI